MLKRIKLIFPEINLKSQLRIICKQFWHSWSIREKSEKSNKARRAASRHKDYQLPKCQKKKNGSGGCVNVTIGNLRDETKTEKCNRFTLAKQQLCTCITHFCTFLCLPYASSRIEKDTVKAINATISPWSRTRSPLFSYKLLSLLSSNWVTWHEGEKVWKDFKSIFQWPLHWRCRCQIVRSLMKSSPSTLPPTHRMPQPRFKGIGSSRPWRGRGTRLPTHLPNPP